MSAAIESAVRIAEKEQTVPLGSLLERIEAGWSPACDTAPPGANEWGVVRVSAVTSGRFVPEESKRLPQGLAPRPDIEIQQGDLLMARANGARNLVGTVCLVDETRAKLMLSDKTLRLTPDKEMAHANFLSIILSTTVVRTQIESLLSGSTGQGNISQSAVQELMVPNVPLPRQQRIIDLTHVLDEQIRRDQDELEKLRKLKLGLADDLLVGEGR